MPFVITNVNIYSIYIPKFYYILFYHLKKVFYQLYYTILQYSHHPNFYFTIQHIKIIFLPNKIIYPKTQINKKNPKPKNPKEEREIDKVSEKNIRHRLVELLNNSFSVFKQHYTHFHTFSPTCISKNYKQHYLNSSTK